MTLAIVQISVLRAGTAGEALLRDGFTVVGVEGTISTAKRDIDSKYIAFEDGKGWLFRLNADVSDDRATIKAGASLQLLPASTLEKIVADASEHPGSTYRLWGRVTKYKGTNYIFPEFFLPIVKTKSPEPPTPQEPNAPQQPAEPQEPNLPREPNEPPEQPAKTTETTPEQALGDPNAILEMPKEVLEKIREKKVVVPRAIGPRPKAREDPNLPAQAKGEPEKPVEKDSAQPAEPEKKAPKTTEPAERAPMKLDAVLADRTAVLVKQDKGRFAFVLDALGFSVQDVSLVLLPCEALELTEARHAAAVNRPRFKIAGIKTTYKGKDYLLLQKATRIYGHGNFGR